MTVVYFEITDIEGLGKEKERTPLVVLCVVDIEINANALRYSRGRIWLRMKRRALTATPLHGATSGSERLAGNMRVRIKTLSA